MRTLILIIVCFILIVAFHTCNFENNSTIAVNSNELKVNSVSDSTEGPCCNNHFPGPNECTPQDTRYLTLGNPTHDIEISCECCRDIWLYYEGNLPPPEQIPENIVNLAGCDEAKIEQ